MADEDIGAQAFADDDEERIVGLDMRWELARPSPPTSTLRDWRRDAAFELVRFPHLLT